MTVRVYYADRLYGEYASPLTNATRLELPDGVYIYFTRPIFSRQWYLKDLTPVLDEDVPSTLKVLELLLNTA